MAAESTPEKACWYVMRDLSRRHAKKPAYRLLAEMGFKVFTPMQPRVVVENGRSIRREEPILQDLLFVQAVRENLDRVVDKHKSLQYRYIKGGGTLNQ